MSQIKDKSDRNQTDSKSDRLNQSSNDCDLNEFPSSPEDHHKPNARSGLNDIRPKEIL